MSGLSLGTCMSNLRSVALTIKKFSTDLIDWSAAYSQTQTYIEEKQHLCHSITHFIPCFLLKTITFVFFTFISILYSLQTLTTLSIILSNTASVAPGIGSYSCQLKNATYCILVLFWITVGTIIIGQLEIQSKAQCKDFGIVIAHK